MDEEKSLYAFVCNSPPGRIDVGGLFGTGSDGPCRINPLTTGRLVFSGFSESYLGENFRLINEDGTDGGAPNSGTSGAIDGFWWKGSKTHWYKVPDYCTATVTPTFSETGFTVKWCCDSCTLSLCELSKAIGVHKRPCRPGGLRYDEGRAGIPYPWPD